MTEGSGHLMLTTREGSNLGKVLGLAKKRGEGVGSGLEGRWGCEEGGESCPSVPSVPSTHPAGKPWGRNESGGPAQNSFLSGQGCPARSASSRNRARRVGRRGREGLSRLAEAPSSWDPGSRQRSRSECKGQEGAAGRGRDPGSGMGRARMEERGLALHAGGGKGGDSGAGTTDCRDPDRDPRRGASPEAGRAGADLTACEEARRGRPG